MPATHITRLQLTPDLVTGAVMLDAQLNQPCHGFLRLELSLGGAPLASVAAGISGRDVVVRADIPAAHHGMDRNDLYWTPDSPTLIDVTVTLTDPGMAALDTVESYFGLRSVGIDRGRFLLNDKAAFMRSVLEQGY